MNISETNSKRYNNLKDKINNISDFRPSNIKNIDLNNFSYLELDNMNFHWAFKDSLEYFDSHGLPAAIGENSKDIDRVNNIFFSKGIEGVLELWDVWLKWKYHRLFDPLFNGVTYNEIDENRNRYLSGNISDYERKEWINAQHEFKSKKFLNNYDNLKFLFDYEFAEMSNSYYYILDLSGQDFDPDKTIDYQKKSYINGGKRNTFVSVCYGEYSNLSSPLSDKWNYKLEEKDPSNPVIIKPNKLKKISINGFDDVNSILLYFYNLYNYNISKEGRVQFDLLDKYVYYIKNTYDINLDSSIHK